MAGSEICACMSAGKFLETFCPFNHSFQGSSDIACPIVESSVASAWHGVLVTFNPFGSKSLALGLMGPLAESACQSASEPSHPT
eukprot:scaffold78196_cov31-Attheya_sp.AAC.1